MNVEVVRGLLDAKERASESYWREPRSVAEAMADELPPDWQRTYDHLLPDVEWQTVFLRETVRGHVVAARAWDDFLRWAD